MISFVCPKCGKSLKAPETKVGAAATCPQCGAAIRVPMPGAAGPTAAVEEAPAPAAPTPAPSPLRRFLRLLVALVLIVVVLAASLWGGMAWRAGGIENAPRSFSEFWTRLLQKPAENRP